MDVHALPIDRSWTLFLDRDGVINVRRPGDYVKTWEAFEFIPGAEKAIVALSGLFGRVIVVTNQQGVGKGRMTKADLDNIHARMLNAIRTAGGDIHSIYSAVETEENDIGRLRKPEVGMALQAHAEHPEIDFSRSIMVGDSENDMRFGKALGMCTVFIRSDPEPAHDALALADYTHDSLAAFAGLKQI